MNSNCLKGIRCPKCKNEDSFRVSGEAWFTVSDMGVEDTDDIEWDDDSVMACVGCGFTGKVADFKAKKSRRKHGKRPDVPEDFRDGSLASFTIPHKVRVDIVWLGEGVSGDFNPEDEEDRPLARFDAYDLTKHEDTTQCRGSWDCCRGGQDASFCTSIPATTPKEILESVARYIAERIADASHWKRTLEKMSWLDEKDAEKIHESFKAGKEGR